MQGFGPLPLIILVFMFLGVPLILYAVYHYARKTPAHHPSDATAGVSGWLLVLTSGLLVISPIFVLYRRWQQFNHDRIMTPELIETSEWLWVTGLTWTTTLVAIAVSVIAGHALARRHDWWAVQLAQLALVVMGPILGIVILSLIPGLVQGNFLVDTESSKDFIRACLIALICIVYLRKSRRVEATYGSAERSVE